MRSTRRMSSSLMVGLVVGISGRLPCLYLFRELGDTFPQPFLEVLGGLLAGLATLHVRRPVSLFLNDDRGNVCGVFDATHSLFRRDVVGIGFVSLGFVVERQHDPQILFRHGFLLECWVCCFLKNLDGCCYAGLRASTLLR